MDSRRLSQNRPPREPPTRGARLLSAIGGSVLGGVVGYGLVTAGPGPAPSIFDPHAAKWIFGLAVVCGLLAAIDPRRAWKPSRKYGWGSRYDD